MEKFKELDKRKTSEVERSISSKWNKMHLLDRCIDSRNGDNFVFYDGPIYANG